MSVRNPARSSDRRTIPAHPMGIIQQRPRTMAGAWSNHSDWYAYEWWRIRGAFLFFEAYGDTHAQVKARDHRA